MVAEGLDYFEREAMLNLRQRLSDFTGLTALLATFHNSEDLNRCAQSLSEEERYAWTVQNRDVQLRVDPFESFPAGSSHCNHERTTRGGLSRTGSAVRNEIVDLR
jgi:hypothetical protein